MLANNLERGRVNDVLVCRLYVLDIQALFTNYKLGRYISVVRILNRSVLVKITLYNNNIMNQPKERQIITRNVFFQELIHLFFKS